MIINLSLLLVAVLFACSCDNPDNSAGIIPTPAPQSVIKIDDHILQITWVNPDDDHIKGILLSRKVGEGEWHDNYIHLPPEISGYADSLEIVSNTVISYRLRSFTTDDTSDFSEICAYIDSTCRPTEVCGRQIEGDKFLICWQDNSIGEEVFAIDKKIGDRDWTLAYNIVAANRTELVDQAGSGRDSIAYRISAVAGISTSPSSPVVVLKLSAEINLDNLYFGSDFSFEVLTWNIENFPKRNNATITSLARAVKALQVDLIAFQEIQSHPDFLTLVDSLSDYLGYRATSAYADINLAYLYNTKFVEVDTIYEIYRWEGYVFPRRPLVLQGRWDGTPLTVINNHYKAYDDNESRERRYRASELLVQYMQNNFADDRVIILGDLNDELTDNQYANVFLPFLNLPQNFKFADMSIALGSSTNWSYPTWPSHIDHIIISDELFDDFAQSTTVVKTIRVDDYFPSGWNEYENTISDHRPVGIKMILTDRD